MKEEVIINQQNQLQRHSISKSIFLHLTPGILIGLCYFLLVPFVNSKGFPTVMALSLSGIIVLIPFQLGMLLIEKKKVGKLKNGVIKYCNPIPVIQYFVFIPIVFILTGLIFTLLTFVTDYSRALFTWIPTNLILDMGLNTNYTKEKLVITYVVFLILIVIVLPVIEELYFRGYLLPRMPKKLGKWTSIIHSGLFALYHTWTPWMFITRTIGVFPLIYIVKRKENIIIGIIIHCLLNSIDFILGFLFIMNYQ